MRHPRFELPAPILACAATSPGTDSRRRARTIASLIPASATTLLNTDHRRRTRALAALIPLSLPASLHHHRRALSLAVLIHPQASTPLHHRCCDGALAALHSMCASLSDEPIALAPSPLQSPFFFLRVLAFAFASLLFTTRLFAQVYSMLKTLR